MALRLAYLTLARVLSWLALLARSDADKDAEILWGSKTWSRVVDLRLQAARSYSLIRPP